MSQDERKITPEALLEFLKGRRSIRRYRQEPVPAELVEQILEAGRWAPSASNRQPWEFIVVRNKEVLRQVAQHAAYYFIRMAHVEEAPLLIVMCGNRQSRIYRQFLHEDVGLAGSQMMLQAKALGLGTCWIGALDRKAIANVLNVPDNLEIIGLLTVGFPDEEPTPRPRKALEEIVNYDLYGSRAEGGEVKPGELRFGFLGNTLRRLRLRI